MKLPLKRAAERGILMIDAMVYLAVLGIVLTLAAVIFDKGLRESSGLQRNISDIERAMKAGERWRADVRAATGPIEVSRQTDAVEFAIPQREARVVYEIHTNEVRRLGKSLQPEVVLKGVQSASMEQQRRGAIVGWKWELELERRRKEARIRPLFTFMAVAGGAQ